MSREFLKLRKVIEKRVRYECHVATLDVYHACNIVPKGLRICLEPATCEMSAPLKTKWKNTLHEASKKLLDIIIQHHNSCLLSIVDEENKILAEICLDPHEVDQLQSFEEQKRCQLLKIKQNKLLRDGVNSPISINYKRSAQNSLHNIEHSGESNSSSGNSVVNLSDHVLSEDECRVLSKGLNFCPANGNISEFQLYKDLDEFARTLRLKEYFHDRPQSNTADPKLPSTRHWTPPSQRDKCLDLYIKAVQDDIISAYEERSPCRKNLSKREEAALSTLSSLPDIIIKPADKGGAIVILNKTDYLNEAYRQLNDTSFYRAVSSDPTSVFKQNVQERLSSLVRERKITETTARSLLPLNPVPGRFYLLPKIHKKDHPGRPIVSAIGTVTENLSSFVDTLIKDIPGTLPSYIKDTTDFLRHILDLRIPANSLLVTMDVASLYTNIPQEGGVKAAIQLYEESESPNKPVDSETLEELLKMILEMNNFEFDDKHFIQTNGTSMGTKIGPNYANLFMGKLEREFLATRTLQPLFYKRFIDDIFLIWCHGESSLLEFITAFNSFDDHITFSHLYSASELNFLDVAIKISGETLSTSLYRKPTDNHQYLHFKSSHVKHCKTGIPYSQSLRFKRLCSDPKDFTSNCERLRNNLLCQQYPLPVIDDAIAKADKKDRTELLNDAKPSTSKSQTNLILTYSASAPNVNGILKKHYNILLQSEKTKRVFPEPPRTVYRRARNIKDIVTSSKINNSKSTGCGPCDKPRCKLCPMMQKTETVRSTGSNFSFRIQGNYNCDSENVVYILECTLCHAQYIGQTGTALRMRINNHRSHVNALPHLPISKHVTTLGHPFDKFAVTVLQSGFRTHHDREVRESFLIHKFNTLANGINESAGKLSFLSV